MRIVETGNYTIREIRPYDADKVREAVLANTGRLSNHFPNLAKDYATEVDAMNRVRHLAQTTADEQSGLCVFVATDPNNERVLGLGTRLELTKRQLYILGGLSFLKTNVYPITSSTLIAGWEVEDAPDGLAEAGAGLLLKHGHPSVLPVDEEGSIHRTLTLIRLENKPAMELAAKIGMEQVLSFSQDEPLEIGNIRTRAAGIVDGVKKRRRVYHKDDLALPLSRAFKLG